MKITIIIIAAFIMTPFVITSCDNSYENQKSSERAVSEVSIELRTSQNEVAAEIQSFRIEMAGKIMENNRSIAYLKRRINLDEGTVRIINEGRIIVLESENREMKRIIDNYSDLSMNNWKAFKKEYTDDMKDLGSSLTNFFETSITSK